MEAQNLVHGSIFTVDSPIFRYHILQFIFFNIYVHFYFRVVAFDNPQDRVGTIENRYNNILSLVKQDNPFLVSVNIENIEKLFLGHNIHR